ncbi:Holliday junction resolvase RuvX [Acidiferrobacter sp.]|uniref:Holliday junction resolvase RuvX n=1 Tax=Acidiferrobacter sp. TaxID=1872107 RepID=UPI002639146F|nr:Holliday junction resolvase RuvX [Acidiferrobacter sp.]
MSAETYLGFDYGTKSIGVAVGRLPGARAEGAGCIAGSRSGPDWNAITRLVELWQPQGLVVGLPRNMDGTDNPMTAFSLRFGRRLDGRYHIPVYWVDERLTTVAVREHVLETGVRKTRRKAMLDTLAAVAILQAFFDEPQYRMRSGAP